MTEAGKVAEIFNVAGEAFSKLGSLAMSLQSLSDRPHEASKWGDEEIEMLKSAVKQFGADIEKISEKIKSKSVTQIKTALKHKSILKEMESPLPIDGTPVKSVTAQTTIQTTIPAAAIMTIPRPTLSIQGGVQMPINTRQIGQKSKSLTPMQTATIRSVTPGQMGATIKKIRLDASGGVNVLASGSSAIGSIIRQNTPVLSIAPVPASSGTIQVPIMASNQGFQVLVPPAQTKTLNGNPPTVIPLLQSGIVQKVSTKNSASNVDVES